MEPIEKKNLIAEAIKEFAAVVKGDGSPLKKVYRTVRIANYDYYLLQTD